MDEAAELVAVVVTLATAEGAAELLPVPAAAPLALALLLTVNYMDDECMSNMCRGNERT